MNRDHLGDALDHWKGSLFESLQNARILKDFAVDPLVSDDDRWEPQDFDLYARLLRVQLRQVLQHKMSTAGNRRRQEYFEETRELHGGDLFIDPDTGVATGRVRDGKHVTPAEIGQLLDRNGKPIVAVYQHAAIGRRVADWVNEVLKAICEQIGEFWWCSYESGTVAMLFLSWDRARAAAVAAHFHGILGPHARRIRQGKCHDFNVETS